MIDPKEPKIYYTGSERYKPGYLTKVTIDYHKKQVRGSLELQPEKYNRNVKKKPQFESVWLYFDNPCLRLDKT